MKKRNLLVAVLLVMLAAFALFLLIDRMTPKAFADIYLDAQKPEACQVLSTAMDGSESAYLTGDALQELLSVLESVRYVKEGTYGSAMEGNVYHLFFSAKGAEVFTLHVSDAGKVYTESYCYAFMPDIEPTALSSYLQTLF